MCQETLGGACQETLGGEVRRRWEGRVGRCWEGRVRRCWEGRVGRRWEGCVTGKQRVSQSVSLKGPECWSIYASAPMATGEWLLRQVSDSRALPASGAKRQNAEWVLAGGPYCTSGTEVQTLAVRRVAPVHRENVGA